MFPSVDVDAALGSAGRLRGVAGWAADAGRVRVDAAGWSGRAAGAQDAAAVRLRERCGSVQSVAAAAAVVLSGYAVAAAEAQSRARAAERELRWAGEEFWAAAAAGVPEPAGHGERVRVATRRFEGAVQEYEALARDAAARLRGLRAGVDRRPLSTGGQVVAGVRRFGADVVVSPAVGVWRLTGGAVTDNARWRSEVAGVPGQWWATVSHPVDTAQALLGVPEFRRGEVGAGIGALAGIVVPSRAVTVLSPGAGQHGGAGGHGSGHGDPGAAAAPAQVRFARNMADPDAPLPVRQSIEEMLVRVDLSRHEHASLGHAIRRHVDVDDDYLQDRLTNGTLKDDGTRGGKPPAASAWKDLDTAEETITRMLRDNDTAIRKWLDSSASDRFVMNIDVPSFAGKVVLRDGSGCREVPPVKATATLVRSPDGSAFVETSYLKER